MILLRTTLSAPVPRELPPNSQLPTLTTNVHDHDGEESSLCSSTAVRTFLVSREPYSSQAGRRRRILSLGDHPHYLQKKDVTVRQELVDGFEQAVYDCSV